MAAAADAAAGRLPPEVIRFMTGNAMPGWRSWYSSALMREFEKYVLDDQAPVVFRLWWYRIVPRRSMSKAGRSAPAITSIWI